MTCIILVHTRYTDNYEQRQLQNAHVKHERACQHECISASKGIQASTYVNIWNICTYCAHFCALNERTAPTSGSQGACTHEYSISPRSIKTQFDLQLDNAWRPWRIYAWNVQTFYVSLQRTFEILRTTNWLRSSRCSLCDLCELCDAFQSRFNLMRSVSQACVN